MEAKNKMQAQAVPYLMERNEIVQFVDIESSKSHY